MNFPSVRGGQGLSKGRQGLGERGGVAGGLEQGSWGLGRVSKGLGGWGLERAEGLGSEGGGLDPQGTSGRMFAHSLVRSFGRTDGRTDGRTEKRNGRTEGRTDGRTDGRMTDGRTKKFPTKKIRKN